MSYNDEHEEYQGNDLSLNEIKLLKKCQIQMTSFSIVDNLLYSFVTDFT